MDVTINEYKQFYKNKKADHNWNHDNFKFEKFRKYLYYQHCDLRKQILHTRISNEEYINKNNEEITEKKECNRL